jgi:hypothetical protein
MIAGQAESLLNKNALMSPGTGQAHRTLNNLLRHLREQPARRKVLQE